MTADKLQRSLAAERAEAKSEALERALSEFFVDPNGPSAAVADVHRTPELASAKVQEYLSFRLGEELFAVNILNIKEIIKPAAVTELPRCEPVILGILSLRGTILPVVDLRMLLGHEQSPLTRSARVLIVTDGDELIGLLVDEVRQVLHLADENIEPPPGVFGRSETEHMLGVGRIEGEMYILLDVGLWMNLDRFIRKVPGGRAR